MVVGKASIHNIMGGMESTGGVRLHNHKRKLKQRFDIIKKLGQGTYGKVQLGINKETGQEVAIKTIKKCKIETVADLIRIRREIQIMSSVQHPNIIHIYEVFENREKMVLVMEYAAGGELYDYLSERKVLTELEARRIFRQIATAVFYCHKHKICHRDLKLENILLDQVGNAKIADFGLSNVFDEQRLLNTFCGSPLYASPEIVKGTPYHGPEVDCWSLGVLLYTLVYGAMPFDGSNFKRLVKQISQSDYFEPKKPSPASPLIKDMLTVCPARRADIEKICTHWWVNEGYDQNCLEIAEDLAAQTPVRLDLLLSIVPQSASAEKLLVGDQQAGGDVANDMSSETMVPTRCHSVGSLMELDRNDSERRIRELYDEEPRPVASGDAKRKLETTPSMDETTAAGVKRKERSRRKERTDEREPRTYRSGSRHHSAPIPNSITEEAMEVDPSITVPMCKTVDANKIEAAAACLELIEESKEKSPSKERSKTPVIMASPDLQTEMSQDNIEENHSLQKHKEEELQKQFVESSSAYIYDKSAESFGNTDAFDVLTNETMPNKQLDNVSLLLGVPTKDNSSISPDDLRSTSQETDKIETIRKDEKKLKEKALSLDSGLSNEAVEPPTKTVERRRSKIFETAEKFNQMATNMETDKPKKIFIPGVNVGGAKRVFERKASLSSLSTPPAVKANASKVIIDVPGDKKNEKVDEKIKTNREILDTDEKLNKRDEAKKRAVDIITGAIGKPPVQRKVNGSPPVSPPSQDSKNLGLKIQVAPNDVRTATVFVSTPVETKFSFDNKLTAQESVICSAPDVPNTKNSQPEEPKMSSKVEITLKSATLPRPRKTSKAEITLSGVKSSEPAAFKSEVEAKIDVFHPQKLRTQRSEVAFPVAAAVPHINRSSSLEPDIRPKSLPKERIIPIQVESDHQRTQHSATPPPKPPVPQRSTPQQSGSLSRQSTADSDTDSALGSTVGPEPIRKSPREYIIPIAVEGGGYVTPRSGSVEPESKASTPTSTNTPRSRFSRPRRMSSLLSDASEDESPFSTLQRDSEDLLQRHMHRLRSSRPSRQPPEHADSLSSGEDDDDDGFELLTAENLFSTLLSRVRSLTQRLNVDDNRSSGFPSSRLLGRLGSNSPQAFWGLNKPLSRRLSESQFRHSVSRDTDIFSRKDSANCVNPGSPSSPGSQSTPSRESVFEIGSNTLPRDKVAQEDTEAEAMQTRREVQDSLEQNFTPSLARRLSRQLAEESRKSSSIEKSSSYASENPGKFDLYSNASSSDRLERRSGSVERPDRPYMRRSVSLFEDKDSGQLPPFPRQPGTLGRRYRDSSSKNLHAYRTEKIREEAAGDGTAENGTASECTSTSMSTSISNPNTMDTTSSLSAKSYETSSGDSNALDASRNFESRLLAAENLIKESKLRNLSVPPRFNPNLCSSYKDTDKCVDKESLSSIADATSTIKRRSCIPSLRLRSASLTRDGANAAADRRKSFCASEETLASRALTPERSLLSKLFGANGKEQIEQKDKPQKPKQHRISRFLRPDFFDTPREESEYAKEKEARKAAENERRKSRFMRKKTENSKVEDGTANDKSRTTTTTSTADEDRRNGKTGFLQSLEKKLERYRSSEDTNKSSPVANGGIRTMDESLGRVIRENSAPLTESSCGETETIKRTISVEDLTSEKQRVPSAPKKKVSSVLGFFKSTDETRAQNSVLGKSKKSSPPKSSTGDDASSSTSSKIPTKLARNDVKSPKKVLSESKSKSPEKSVSDAKKRSPPPPKGDSVMKERKASTKEIKKKEADSTAQSETSSSTGKEERKKLDSPPRVEDGKKLVKGKKSTSTTKIEKSDDSEKKSRKLTKVKGTSAEKEEADGTKKKKLVRVVKRVVKKSTDESAESSKAEDKGKTTSRPLIRRIVSSRKDDASESNAVPIETKENETDARTTRDADQQRGNRATLKLDLSKIPRHAFGNSSGSPGTEESVSVAEEAPPDKLMETLSRMTHRASITGNKIIIDKPLRARDVAELKKEVTECARIIEAHNAEQQQQQLHEEHATNSDNVIPARAEDDVKAPPPQPPVELDRTEEKEETTTPPEEPESFDSWSVCSLDANHMRGDLHSPTSPSYSLGFYIGGDHSESVIDRIRRRSFYSRFNDRRRPSLTVPPPGITLPTTSLSRKISLDGSSKLRSYPSVSSSVSSSSRADDALSSYRRSPSGKERYTDVLGASPSLDHYSGVATSSSSSSSYDPLRRYARSPTFDLSSDSWRRYRSTDFSADVDLGSSYRGQYSSRSSATLPRKYGSTVNNAEPKSVEYYEELLAPSNTDYLTTRRSTISNEYAGRGENGYHNGGSIELSRTMPPVSDERRTYPERILSADVTDGGAGEYGEKIRSTSRQSIDDPKNLPSTSSDPRSNSCAAE